MGLSVFGAQPLLPLASEFNASSQQAAALATTLGGVGESLADMRTDVAGIGVELDALSAELASLREASGAGGPPPPLRPFVLLLVAWLLVPAIGGVLGGLALLRLARVTATAP
jgi:hypothetical protein